ncbi:putative E3 Ubiquitin-Protein Ligase Herc1 [Manis pentadactyla]|nr:putative E3 Ubiquitin-Protein Ligase Herc1 [Manis pentadactyla]
MPKSLCFVELIICFGNSIMKLEWSNTDLDMKDTWTILYLCKRGTVKSRIQNMEVVLSLKSIWNHRKGILLLSPSLAALFSSSPSEPLPPPRFSPTRGRYLLGGGRRGCPVFARGTARRGDFGTGRSESKYLNTEARIRGWDGHSNLGIPRRSARREIVQF